MSKNQEMDTKQRLLVAAIKVFSAKGFKAATVREICQEADVNIAAVNYHFGDKQQLYGMVLDYIFSYFDTKIDPELAAIAESDAPPEERLRAHITAGVLQMYDQCGEICQGEEEWGKESSPMSLFLMEMAHPTKHLDDIVSNYIARDAQQLYSILRGYLGPKASGETIKQCSDSIWGQILHSAMCHPIEQRLHGDALESIDARAMAEHICTFTIGGLNQIKKQLENETE